jgi:thiamine-phosphate pyrophosphorylase
VFEAEQLAETRLCFVLEARPHWQDPGPLLEAALQGGVDLVVLRDLEPTVEVAELFRELTDQYGALLAVADRPDLALACGADAVHAEDLTVAEVRRFGGAEMLAGRSIRAPDEVVDSFGADYLFVGPVYPTPTKPESDAVGLETVQRAAERCPVPFFAIGGIDVENAAQVVEAGAERLAVVRAIRDSDDPADAARRLRALVTQS